MPSNRQPTTSNIISGKIVVKETGIGIPDLLVVIHDLDPGAKPDDGFTTADAPILARPVDPLLADRLGSVLSAQNGSWSIEYDDTEFRILNPTEKRPDLQLMVLAPEDADSGSPPLVLFSSKLLRVNSGRTEAYMIRISSAQLEKARIKVPIAEQEDDTTEAKIKKYEQARTAKKALRKGFKDVNTRLDGDVQELESRKKFRDTIRKSILPNLDALHSMTNFVKDTQSIAQVQEEVYKDGVDSAQSIIEKTGKPGKGIKISLMLTDDEKDDLEDFKFTIDGIDYYDIPEADTETLLLKKESGNSVNSILFTNNPISKFCIQKSTEDKCAEIHTGIRSGEETDGAHATSDNGSDAISHNGALQPINISLTKEDIPSYLGSLLADKSSGHFQNNTISKSPRPDGLSVQKNVDNFALKKGPADTTAFYDFHSLQIAFRHVWHQLLDETLVNLSEKIQEGLENAGKKGLHERINERLAGIKGAGPHIVVASAEDAATYSSQEVPTEISAAFDISFAEYDALNGDDKDKLSTIAKELNAIEWPSPPTASFLGFSFSLPYSTSNATYAALRREQGERIIDNARANKPLSTNQLLKDLQERLLSKYEFTVFAANKDYHSINFGLLNTFRQKWEPISYQAGKLVKTIPLTPKEERKYSVKTTQNLKTTRKQALKNNSALQNEVNTVSRSESDIVAKAHDKSNFNMSVKLDYSKISSEVTFGKEAEKETSQAKKDFREAVIKAAQEYKEERSLEIDTEQTINSEYNESGTIVNPNDELSVTCLFYELQRRYRISEQLYRVMPVVLVAQEVPSPDQINEAWIVAHDWIINRVLLDDSFRSTLQYIAQKNVGDDFAIRELRKNLRQQRTLVRNLQLEFSKLKQDVENKYAAMERSVQERIQTEHDKRLWRWWWWWDNNDRPDTPPDPEMAKALEQAATDEHKYAVEKAEKIALSVQREVNALHQITLEYNNAMREHLDGITQTRRLVTHIKNNILYYMQAIWSMEPPDQRFMRLYKVEVPQFEATRKLVVEDKPAKDIFESFREPGTRKYTGWLQGELKRDGAGNPIVTYKQLVEVADLDTILGFKGNYMIFPLKEHNALTKFMAAPYVDEAFGAMDPDQLSNVNLEEFSKYICCLHDESPDKFAELQLVLKEWLEQLLADPLRNGDEIVIPTGSLFIELLPSDRPLLEDFKLKHREWDVYKAQAEVRRMELENVRYAARLLNAEMEDPDIERKIVVTNGTQASINVDNP
jgi:hypothetical protein